MPSGFVKTPVSRGLYLGPEGLEGDGQADRQNHGGPDKAVCVYPGEHYPYWQERLGKPLGDAAFGENFTTRGLTEEDVCIGDVYQIEQAIVQVSQPRKPCFKLAARHGEPKLTLWVQETGLSGWYFRVLQPGEVSAGAPLERLTRPGKPLTIAQANRVMHIEKRDVMGIERLLAQDALARSWRVTLEQRLAGSLEDTSARLTGRREGA